MNAMDGADAIWPDLAYGAWRETLATLHLWTQIVGKIRLTLTPWLNHGWQAPLYVTARGLGTSPDRPNFFEFERRFLTNKFAFVPGRWNYPNSEFIHSRLLNVGRSLSLTLSCQAPPGVDVIQSLPARTAVSEFALPINRREVG